MQRSTPRILTLQVGRMQPTALLEEGRALRLSTSDRDPRRLGMLARLALRGRLRLRALQLVAIRLCECPRRCASARHLYPIKIMVDTRVRNTIHENVVFRVSCISIQTRSNKIQTRYKHEKICEVCKQIFALIFNNYIQFIGIKLFLFSL